MTRLASPLAALFAIGCSGDITLPVQSCAADAGYAELPAVTDAGALPRFSFFVTSQRGLVSLSGCTQGFGGDLRYGERVAGAGLRGADRIGLPCRSHRDAHGGSRDGQRRRLEHQRLGDRRRGRTRWQYGVTLDLGARHVRLRAWDSHGGDGLRPTTRCRRWGQAAATADSTASRSLR